MCHSMTGYGASRYTESGITIQCEIKTVNGRYLDVVTRFPREYLWLESLTRKRVAEVCQRGRVEVFISIVPNMSSQAGINATPVVDSSDERFEVFFRAAEKLFSSRGLWSERLQEQLAVDILFRKDILSEELQTPPIQEEVFDGLLREALEALRISQRREGVAIHEDLLNRREIIAEHLQRVDALQRERRPEREALLSDKLQEYLEGGVLPPERIVAEVALLLEKADIEEELVRLRTHLGRFESVLSEVPCGRKFDFLLQECLREANTIASKIQQADAQHAVIEIKSEIERMKEQAQNLE